MIGHPQEITVREIRDLLRGIFDPRILEIGAHDGESTVQFFIDIPNCSVVAYEPDPRPAERFKSRLAGRDRLTFRQVAVGRVNGTVEWYASHGSVAGHHHDWDYSSSLKRPTGHLDRSKEISFTANNSVPCVRLDDEGFDRFDFAWIDAQGAQRDIIEGGRKTLDATSYIYVELHNTPLYDGEPTFDELHALLFNHMAIGRYGENILFKRA